MKNRKLPIIAIAALVTAAVALAVLSSGLLMAQQNIASGGSIGSNITSSVNIGVYTDEIATQNCTNIAWGTLAPGSVSSQTVYIKNTGDTPETLSMTTSNWSPPSASAYLTLTWNEQGTVLAAGSVVPATLTLTVSSYAGNLTSFSFNIVISGSGNS